MPRPKKDNPLTRVTVSVDPGDYRQMEELARQNGHSTARLIRRSMKEFLARHARHAVPPADPKETPYD